METHLRVERKRGEEVRKKLMAAGVLDRARKVIRDGDYLLLPVKEEIDLPGTEIVRVAGKGSKMRALSLSDSLKDVLSAEELAMMPRSFDIIGDIAVLEIPEELMSKGKSIGESLLSTFKNIKVVARKKTSVGTEYRTREVEVLAGEPRTETTHKEYGCLYRLDVSNAYFSPRLGTERMRVASQVKEDERVLVMFAGVGPYAILIAKKRKPSEVVAIELNPSAVEYMKENVKLNKAKVVPVLGDVKTETPKLGRFDRIIMPLPKDAGDFLDVALPTLNKGGVIHYYTFTGTTKEAADEVRKICSGLGRKADVLASVECGTYSPCLSRMCVDFRLI